MNYEEVLNTVMQQREQTLVRMGYLEGQADLLRAIIQEEKKANERVPPNPGDVIDSKGG